MSSRAGVSPHYLHFLLLAQGVVNGIDMISLFNPEGKGSSAERGVEGGVRRHPQEVNMGPRVHQRQRMPYPVNLSSHTWRRGMAPFVRERRGEEDSCVIKSG